MYDLFNQKDQKKLELIVSSINQLLHVSINNAILDSRLPPTYLDDVVHLGLYDNKFREIAPDNVRALLNKYKDELLEFVNSEDKVQVSAKNLGLLEEVYNSYRTVNVTKTMFFEDHSPTVLWRSPEMKYNDPIEVYFGNKRVGTIVSDESNSPRWEDFGDVKNRGLFARIAKKVFNSESSYKALHPCYNCILKGRETGVNALSSERLCSSNFIEYTIEYYVKAEYFSDKLRLDSPWLTSWLDI